MSVNFELFDQTERIFEEFRQFSKFLDSSSSSTKTAKVEEKQSPVSIYVQREADADSRKESVVELENCLNVPPPKPEKDQGAYLGIMTLKDAERKVVRPGQFAVYHRMPIALATKLCAPRLQVTECLEPSPSLYLNVVYMDSASQYRHYPIIEVEHKDKKFFQVLTTLSSDEARVSSKTKSNKIQYEKEPRFLTVEKLLDHYTKFAYGYRFDENGGIEIDVFPAIKN